MESLADRLKSLGVQIGTSNLLKPAVQDTEYPIQDVVDGYFDETPLGQTFVFEKMYPADYRQGEIELTQSPDLSVISAWAKLDPEVHLEWKKMVFLDTETSGLAGGSGSFAFLIGLGFIMPEGFRLIQLFMRDPAEEGALLATLGRFLVGYDTVVTFNGKTFDIPLLNNRHVLNKQSSPFSTFNHIDMLPMARRIWRNRLPSRALKDLEVDILHLTRSEDEVPGWMIPDMYFDFLRTRDARPMAGIFYHNGMDILSLAALTASTGELLASPLQAENVAALDLIAIAKLYEDIKQPQVALQLYERSLQYGLPEDFYIQTLQRYAILYRRQGNWPEALRLWTQLAELNNFEGAVDAAKCCEHQLRDIKQAIAWTEKAGLILDKMQCSLTLRKLLKKDLATRHARLIKLAEKL